MKRDRRRATAVQQVVEQGMDQKPAQSRAPDLWIATGLLVATLAVYAQVHAFDFINYDDPDYVSANAHVRGGLTPQNIAWAFTSTEDANWLPLTRLSHLVAGQMFGMWAGGHHLINMALHAASALLLFAWVRRVAGVRWPAAFVAFVFAIHPLHVESVAWVAERKDVLSGLFSMLTLWAYLSYLDRPNGIRYAGLLALFACGLMSKPMLVTLPAVLLLVDYWRERPFSKTVIIEKIPLFALSAASAAITYMVQQRAGAVSSLAQIPPGSRIANALVSGCIYVLKFFWPAKLAVFYPFSPIPVWMAIAAGAALAAITAVTLSRRAPHYLTVGWLWYIITLTPVIGLVQVGVQSRADRYTYIPLIGVSIMVAFGAADLARRAPRWKATIFGLPAAACVAWTIAAAIDTGYWRDSIRLFERAIDSTDRNYVAYENLGNALRDAGRAAEAIADFKRAVEIQPGFAEGQNNLGQALLAQGRVEEAVPHLTQAVRLEPQSATAHVNLGAALRRREMLDQAEQQYRAALAIEPENEDAVSGLATVLGQEGHTEDAIGEFAHALRIQPDDADAHYNLGRLLAAMGRPSEAMAQFAQAVRLKPSNAEAHFNLGNTFAATGDFEKAAAEFASAVRLQPDYIRAHFNLASALANLERYQQAAQEFDAVLKLQPDFPDARRNFEACRDLARRSRK